MLCFSFCCFSKLSARRNKTLSNKPETSAAFIKDTYTWEKISGYFSIDFENGKPPSMSVIILVTTPVMYGLVDCSFKTFKDWTSVSPDEIIEESWRVKKTRSKLRALFIKGSRFRFLR